MKNNWKIDQVHSEVKFEIDYLMISKISGFLTGFDASFQTDENGFKNMNTIKFSANADSINTNSVLRDEHLKSEEFFDIIKYADITFVGTDFVQGAGELPLTILSSYRKDFKMAGNLTLKGITKPIILNGIYGGSEIDMQGRKKAGFNIIAKFNRKDFALSGNTFTEAGKLVLGEEITITANCQFINEI